MGVWYSRERKLKPVGISLSWMAPAMLVKNQTTRATTTIPDTIWAAHWMTWTCRQTGIPW